MKAPTPAAEDTAAARDTHVLPPLPRPFVPGDEFNPRDFFTSEQMHEYARAALATPSAAPAQPVARVDSLVNGSYHRKYTLTWLEDVPEGALLYTAPPAAQPVAPAGWKLVPLEPTNAMTFVGQQLRRDPTNSISHVYGAMLAAAPSASEAPRQEPAA